MTTFPRILPLLEQARRLLWDDTTVIIYGTDAGGTPVTDSQLSIRRTVGPVPDDVRRLMLSVGDWDDSTMQRRISDGTQCVAPLVNGACAGYCWVTRSKINVAEVGFERTLSPGQIWIFHCHTMALCRGRGLYPNTLLSIVKDLSAAGLSVAWPFRKHCR